MVRQSCPTARLRGATRIQNRKLWREYGRRPFCLRLASMTWRGRGVRLRVQLRALSGNPCEAYERWGRGERDAAFPRHGRDKAAGALSSGGARGHRLQRAGRPRQRTAGGANVGGAGASSVGSSAAGAAARVPATPRVMQACGAPALRRRRRTRLGCWQSNPRSGIVAADAIEPLVALLQRGDAKGKPTIRLALDRLNALPPT